jgi:hypothetical protein
MSQPELPITTLLPWSFLNDVSFFDVEVKELDGRGCGLLCRRSLSTEAATFDTTLVTVPHNLVLNREAVEEYAKEDRNFRCLMDAVGHQVSSLTYPSTALSSAK